ncbi:MAG: hypothetical protein AB7I59_01850 [Geminicoccaceae bacterium]
MNPAQSNHYLLDVWAGATSVQATNRYLLNVWELAYAYVGEAMLPLFGLSDGDIDAVLTVAATTRRRWAEQPDSIVRPRPGLLPALQAKDQDRIASFRALGHGAGMADVADRPVLTEDLGGKHRDLADTAELIRLENRLLLALWQQVAGDDEAAERTALSSADRVALAAADELTRQRCVQFPITLAEPRPGLLPALLKREEPQLTAFLESLQR